MEEKPKYQAGMKVVDENGRKGEIVGEPEYDKFYENFLYSVKYGSFEKYIPEHELSIADKPDPSYKVGDKVIDSQGVSYTVTEILDFDICGEEAGQNLFCWFYWLKNEAGESTLMAEQDLVYDDPATTLRFFYRNHRGYTSVRRAVPENLWFGKSPYYDQEQYFITALDLDKKETRDFALLRMQIIHTKPTPNNLIAVQYPESMIFGQGERVKTVTPRFAPGDRVMFSTIRADEDGELRSLVIHSGVVRFVNVFDFVIRQYSYCIEANNNNRTIYSKVFESQIIANLGEYPSK